MRATTISAQVIGGPYCGSVRHIQHTTEPVLFTEVLPATPQLDAPSDWTPPTRMVSIFPSLETLPTGMKKWVLRWPPFQKEGAAA